MEMLPDATRQDSTHGCGTLPAISHGLVWREQPRSPRQGQDQLAQADAGVVPLARAEQARQAPDQVGAAASPSNQGRRRRL